MLSLSLYLSHLLSPTAYSLVCAVLLNECELFLLKNIVEGPISFKVKIVLTRVCFMLSYFFFKPRIVSKTEGLGYKMNELKEHQQLDCLLEGLLWNGEQTEKEV